MARLVYSQLVARAAHLAATVAFTSRSGVADRLVLTTKTGADLGGWGFGPLCDKIEAAVSQAIAEQLPKKRKTGGNP